MKWLPLRASKQAATKPLLAQLTAAVVSSTTATQNITAAALYTQEDTAAAAEDDTQPAAANQGAAQGTAAAADNGQLLNLVASVAQNDIVAAQMTQEQNDTAATAENDTQPAATGQGVGQGTVTAAAAGEQRRTQNDTAVEKGHDHPTVATENDTQSAANGHGAGSEAAAAGPGDRREYDLDSPAANLQQLFCFEIEDERLFSDIAKRVTTNGPSVYSYMMDADVDLCTPLEEGIATPRLDALKAIKEFKASTVGWLRPLKHTLTTTRMEDMLHDKKSVAYADVVNLVCLAIRHFFRMDDLILEVKAASGYDRSQCSHAGIIDEPGFAAFDFEISAGASELWVKLRELLDAFFAIPD